MNLFKSMDAISDDDDLLFVQRHAPIYRAASLVIDEIGEEEAAAYAAERADFLDREGDVLGAEAWRRVAPLIEELQRRRRRNKGAN